MMIVNMKHELA